MLLSVCALLLLAGAAVGQQCGTTPIAPDPEVPFKDEESKRMERVVGGRPAIPGSWPWQISLRRDASMFHTCGGSIIKNQWVITAAHCVNNDVNRPYNFRVDVGRYYKDQPSASLESYDVDSIHVHPQYNPFTIDNDIALLHIATPIRFNSYVQPVCLPSRDANVNEMARITGWGMTMGTGWDTVLKQAGIPIVEQNYCRSWMGFQVSNNMICAGYDSGEHGGCMGDSGGPLVVKANANQWMLVGLVSWGRRTCDAITVFNRVRNYVVNGFIESIIGPL